MQQTQKVYINHLDRMKPLAFLSLMKMIETEYKGGLSRFDFHDPFGPGMKITEKVDGSALRFGLNYHGHVFVESSTSPPMFCVGDFVARDKSKGYDGSVGRNFDFILQCIQNDKKLLGVLRKFSNDGIKIIGEVLFMPMAKAIGDNLAQFIRIPYYKLNLGHLWTFVPIKVLDGRGNRYAGEQCVIQALLDISTAERMYVSPEAKLTHEVIDLTAEIKNINTDLYELNDVRDLGLIKILSSRKHADRVAKAALTSEVHKHQEAVRDKILSYVDQGLFGPFIEGLVIEFPNRTLLKVITPEFKNAQ